MAQKWYFWVCVLVGISFLAFGLGCEEGEDSGSASSVSDELNTAQDDDVGGNGAPHGKHYTLNIVGSKFVKKPDLHNPGRRIFPPLSGSTDILLSQGGFRVLDANGTDGPAEFRLLNPDPENDGVPAYTVWARTMATPVGASTTTVCATAADSGEKYCSATSLELTRENGKPIFSNVSEQLLYLYADVNKDGALERYPLFDEAFVDYYWFYDNENLKHAQLRFYGPGDDDDDDDDNDDNDDNDDTGDDDDDDTDSDTDVVIE